MKTVMYILSPLVSAARSLRLSLQLQWILVNTCFSITQIRWHCSRCHSSRFFTDQDLCWTKTDQMSRCIHSVAGHHNMYQDAEDTAEGGQLAGTCCAQSTHTTVM